MSTLYVDNLQPNLGSQVEIPQLKPLAGSVINTWQAVKTDTQSSQGFNFVDVTGLSITVTPSSVNSKFLISWRLIMSADYYASYMKVVRDAQTLFTGDTASNRFTGTGQYALEVVSSNAHGFTHQHVGQYLDTPSKDTPTTFKLQFSGRAAAEGYGGVSYINRTVPDRDTATYDPRLASNIIVQEIAG